MQLDTSYIYNLFENDKVKLRPTTDDDINVLATWWNDPSINIFNRKTMMGTSFKVVKELFEKWSVNNTNSGQSYTIINHSNDIVGHISLWGLSVPELRVFLGIFISPKYQNMGYGTAAMKLMMNLAFNEMNANKIELCVYSFNDRALKLYENLGFIREGQIRSTIYHNGKYYDEIIMGLLKEEYKI